MCFELHDGCGTKALIYDPLPPGVIQELERKNPRLCEGPSLGASSKKRYVCVDLMSDASLTEQLLAELDRCAHLRTRVVEDALFRERRAVLRAWQAERLARTHGDLLPRRRG